MKIHIHLKVRGKNIAAPSSNIKVYCCIKVTLPFLFNLFTDKNWPYNNNLTEVILFLNIL